MSPTAQKIREQIKSLPRGERVELLHDLQSDLEAERPIHERFAVRNAEDLQAKLVEGLESPASPMTSADWEEIRRDAIQHHKAQSV